LYTYNNPVCYAAIGDGGNVIYVSPAKKLVVAISSRFMPRAKDRIESISKHFTPLFE
jgi:excinuclease UvrABC nuclease subunit